MDKLRRLRKLSELRLQHCPVLSEYSVHERRMMLISRLPNVKILNGGKLSFTHQMIFIYDNLENMFLEWLTLF